MKNGWVGLGQGVLARQGYVFRLVVFWALVELVGWRFRLVSVAGAGSALLGWSLGVVVNSATWRFLAGVCGYLGQLRVWLRVFYPPGRFFVRFFWLFESGVSLAPCVLSALVMFGHGFNAPAAAKVGLFGQVGAGLR